MSREERLLIMIVYPVLVCHRLLIRYLPYRVWSRPIFEHGKRIIYHSSAAPPRALSKITGTAREVGRSVERASRILPGSNCLDQALCCSSILKALGHKPVLRIGVIRDLAAPFQAHAWVEAGSRIVVGNIENLDSYRQLPVESFVRFFASGRKPRGRIHRII